MFLRRLGVTLAVLGVLGVAMVAMVAMVGCKYVEAGSEVSGGSEFPGVVALVNEAERLDMEPGEYADRLYRGKLSSIEDRYDKKIGNASGTRLDRLENARERELSELGFNYQDLCIALERRDYVCSEET